MNENQKTFLDELAALFDKYSIREMFVENGFVVFISQEETLAFSRFSERMFDNIRTFQLRYTAKEEAKNVE